MKLEVTKIVQESHDCRTLYLIDHEEKKRAFDYIAGQYLTFRFDELAAKPVVRSYTMSSSPCQSEDIAVTVKEVDDGFISRYLCREVQVGDVLRARGAIGKFCYDPTKDHQDLVMVAAGSGVTPFVSIMREYAPLLGCPEAPRSLTLLVAFRSRQDLICWDTLASLKHSPGVKVITCLSREDATNAGFWHGRICPEFIDQAVEGSYEGKTFMTCGPEEMMAMTVKHVREQNVALEHMKTESFAN